jgi:2-oxoglutarate dehydrogenase E2 component (dihydrolipoamide succinyltransferase)
MEIKVPEVGESIHEALVAKWLKQSGEAVRRDEPVCELETDKITLELNAETDGILTVTVPAGTTVKIGTVIGAIAEGVVSAPPPPAPVAAKTAAPAPEPPPVSPAVRKAATEKGIPVGKVPGTGRGGRVTMDDLFGALQREEAAAPSVPAQAVRSEEPTPYTASTEKGPSPIPSPPSPIPSPGESRETRTPMSPIRRRIAERLVAVRQQTAMLTTFNEADLARVQELRKKYREHFEKKHGSGLGLMPFFVKACIEALREFPTVNARIDGNDIVQQHFYDIGIAVSGDKGLVVPVLRDADRLHLWEIEQRIGEFGEKVKTNKLAITDLEGGTFSITNGGVFGSLLSTPILNPPQSGVLGMHAIQERPVARSGKVVVRPMMYLALSYDHRIIDGREAVQFLKKVKEYIEEPEELLLEG